MESVIKTIILVYFLLCFAPKVTYGQAIIDFTDRMKNICGNENTILSKKIFLTILKSKQTGQDPCQNQYLLVLSKNCKTNVCNKIVTAYESAIKSFKGNVIGQ